MGDESVLENEQKLSAMINQLQKLREQILHKPSQTPQQRGSPLSQHGNTKVSFFG